MRWEWCWQRQDGSSAADHSAAARSRSDPIYSGRSANQLIPTRVQQAHNQGYTGVGVKIGLLNSATVDGYAPLERKTAFCKDNDH